MNSDFSISLPSNEAILIRELLTIVPIMTSHRKLYLDLVIIDIQDFDVILGMDLLSKYSVIIHYRRKNVVFNPTNI